MSASETDSVRGEEVRSTEQVLLTVLCWVVLIVYALKFGRSAYFVPFLSTLFIFTVQQIGRVRSEVTPRVFGIWFITGTLLSVVLEMSVVGIFSIGIAVVIIASTLWILGEMTCRLRKWCPTCSAELTEDEMGVLNWNLSELSPQIECRHCTATIRRKRIVALLERAMVGFLFAEWVLLFFDLVAEDGLVSIGLIAIAVVLFTTRAVLFGCAELEAVDQLNGRTETTSKS